MRPETGISVTKKSITDTTVFSAGCRERFLQTETGWSDPLAERGISLAGLSQMHAGSTLARKDKTYHSILGCIEGECRLETGETDYLVKSGDLWFVPAHVPFRYRIDSFWEVAWFHITQNDPKHYGFGNRIELFHDLDTQDLFFAMNKYSLESTTNSPPSEPIGYALRLLIGAYLDRLVFSCREGQLDARSRQLCSLWREVKEKPAFAWTTENMADKLGLSPGYFRTMVRTIEGETAMNVVTSIRMDHARVLIRQSDHKLSTVAHLVGYNSPFSFSRAFKRVVGVSPMDYRQSVREAD